MHADGSVCCICFCLGGKQQKLKQRLLQWMRDAPAGMLLLLLLLLLQLMKDAPQICYCCCCFC